MINIISDLSYGDKVVVTYKNLGNREDPRGVTFPEIQQDIGYFLQYRKLIDSENSILHLTRRNPTLIGKFEDLPKIGDMGPPDNSNTQYNKRHLLLDESIYLTSQIISIEKL